MDNREPGALSHAPGMDQEDLRTFLHRQPTAVLADLLLELAAHHDEVNKRLARLQLADSPAKLASAFNKQLAAWKRSRKFRDYQDSRVFAAKLELWLDQVANELVPRDPMAAADLFEAFIGTDATFFENSDDSGGDIGDAVRAACRHWLAAAARCETPSSAWQERLLKLAEADEYGAREVLLREAATLIPEPGLREMVAVLEGRMALLVAKHRGAPDLPYEVIKVSSAMSLLAQAMGDPDVKARSILSYRADPNPLQLEGIVRAYLDAGRAADGMKWLQEDWGHLDDRRQRLLAEAHSQLGQEELSHPLRRKLFEEAPSVDALRQWIDALPPTQLAEAAEHARSIALAVVDPGRAAAILLELNFDGDAEHTLVERSATIDGSDYIELPALAKLLAKRGLMKGETAVVRALLLNILERGYSPAYRHAARYLHQLRVMAATDRDVSPLASHVEFEAGLKAKHGRKNGFWQLVEER